MKEFNGIRGISVYDVISDVILVERKTGVKLQCIGKEYIRSANYDAFKCTSSSVRVVDERNSGERRLSKRGRKLFNKIKRCSFLLSRESILKLIINSYNDNSDILDIVISTIPDTLEFQTKVLIELNINGGIDNE